MSAMPLSSPVDNSGFRPGHTGPDLNAAIHDVSSWNILRVLAYLTQGGSLWWPFQAAPDFLEVYVNFIDNYEHLRISLLQDFFISSCKLRIPAVHDLLFVCAGQRVWRVMR